MGYRRAHYDALKRSGRDAYVADLRDGRKFRAATLPNKKKAASKKACRKGNW